MTDVLISGQAGVAVLIEGDDVSLLGIESGGKRLRCSPSSVPYLFAGANDVYEVKAATDVEVIGRLKRAWQLDRALQLTLILIDGSEALETKRLSIECLSGLLGDASVLEHVSNRLYSAPLPSTGDLREASSLAAPFSIVAEFLNDLQDNQPQIDRNRTGWDNLPISLFGSEMARKEFQEAAITAGVFRLLGKAGPDAPTFGMTMVQCYLSLATLPNARKVLQAWISPLRPMRIALPKQDESARVLQGAEEYRSRHDHIKAQSTYELFENVKKQKQAIIELLRKGDVARVRAYATQLMDSQLRTSEPEYAAMSLCDLAQGAKTVCNYSLQLELAQKAVETAPEDGWAHGQVADAYICLGQYDNALQSFELAATFGQFAFAANGRARILRVKGKLDEALAAYREAIASYPEDVFAWNGRAEVLRDMWKLDEALAAYDEAIQTFPAEVVPHCGRAAVLTDMGRLEEALRGYQRAIDDFGDQEVALCGRADVLKQMGSLDKAFDAYTTAIHLFPAVPTPRCGQAEVLKDMGKFTEAVQAYSQAAEAFPYLVIPFSGLADTFKRMGNYKEALARYDDLLQRFPDDLIARDGKADVLKRLGRLSESLRAYDENIKRSPYDIVARTGRADLLKELGKLKEAADAYDFILERTPRKQTVKNAKAAILTVLRRYEAALQLLPQGEALTRDEWVGEHIRGMIFLKRGALDSALKIFASGLAKIPFENQRKYFESALAVTKLRMKKFEQAAACLREDQEPLTNLLRMHALGGLKQVARAQEVFQNLESACPRKLIPLRDELAARYGLASMKPRHSSEWIFDEECKHVLLEAA